ncbi:hypothetical protein B0T14DRAFT_495478 [Immersiella caudata]|uniref:Uncharacterized protein n=1 Tax=Immersiella caudata TaxID=314043 RepID=A0AA39WYT8_9PEZI|nr:hypothetical protein B0T14DRAFT_495478 [Immersiella caudata]
MATDGEKTPSGFLSLPSEIRNIIYRLLFRHPRVIFPEDEGVNDWYELTSQLLYTNRQIYTEGISILYGENTFHIGIENILGPFSSRFWGDEGLSGRRGGKAALLYLRRFHLEVLYTDEYRLDTIRDGIRNVVKRLQALPVFDYLGLECDPNARDYRRWQRKDGEGSSQQLAEMYVKLEEDVMALGEGDSLCRKLLHNAVRAVETDDLDGFMRAKESIRGNLTARVNAWRRNGLLLEKDLTGS